MKQFDIIIMLIAALNAIGVARGQETREIAPGRVFKAPDGMFTAKTVGGGLLPATDKITIIDNKTGASAAQIEIDPPLYGLSWTGDSKTLVTVSHIAGGSTAGIIHQKMGRGNSTVPTLARVINTPSFGSTSRKTRSG